MTVEHGALPREVSNSAASLLEFVRESKDPHPEEVSIIVSDILRATRLPQERERIAGPEYFKAILHIYRCVSNDTLQLSEDGYQALIKCICNLSADNDANRQLAVEDSDCLDQLKANIESLPSQLAGNTKSHCELDSAKRADIAVIALFNICNDYEPAQKACYGKSLHVTLQHYIAASLKNNEDYLGLAVNLWSDLLSARGEETLKDATQHDIDVLLDLFATDVEDEEVQGDLLRVVTEQMLSDLEIQRAILKYDRLSTLLKLLPVAVKTHFGLTDTKLGKIVERTLLTCITDLSQLPEYPLSTQFDDSFAYLHNSWIFCEPDYKTVSLSVCAFALLANTVTDDASALAVAEKIDFDKLCKIVLSRLPDPASHTSISTKEDDRPSESAKVLPAEKEYLYTATRFIRQLAGLQSIRRSFSTESTQLDLLNRLLQCPEVDVAEAALQLYNRTLDTTPDALNIWTQWEIDAISTHTVTSYTLSGTIRALHLDSSTHIRLRLEIGLVYTSYLRAAMSLFASSPSSASETSQHTTPSLISRLNPAHCVWDTFVAPVFYLVEQTSVPRYWVQGLLGLAYLSRLPRGALAVQTAVVRDSARTKPRDDGAENVAEGKDAVPDSAGFLDTLEQRIVGLVEAAAEQGMQSLSADGRKRTRDNAIVVLCQLVTSPEVNDVDLRTGLRGIATRAGITVPGVPGS